MGIIIKNIFDDFLIMDGLLYNYSFHNMKVFKRFNYSITKTRENLKDSISKYNLDEIKLNGQFQKINLSNIDLYSLLNKTNCFYSNGLIKDKITSFYQIKTALEIKGKRVFDFYQIPGNYNEVRFDYHENGLPMRDPYYREFFGPAVQCAHDRGVEFVQPIENIDKIIGLKKYRNPEWLGTEREKEFNGKEEEIVLDMRNFDNSIYEIFKQHDAFEIIKPEHPDLTDRSISD